MALEFHDRGRGVDWVALLDWIAARPANSALLLRAAAVIAAICALALLAPLIWAAASAGAGLVTLAMISLAGVAFAQALPLVLQKLENRLLAARKAEARENPIEQLQIFLAEKTRRVQAFKQAVIRIGAQVAGLEDMMQRRKLARPAYDSSRQEASLKAMRDAHAILVRTYENAERALSELREVIEDKKFEWSFGQAGRAAIASLNATGGQELLDEMLADEAFASARENFNHVFAELELEATRLPDIGLAVFDDGSSLHGALEESADFARERR
jgi:hypothetical protein